MADSEGQNGKGIFITETQSGGHHKDDETEEDEGEEQLTDLEHKLV